MNQHLYIDGTLIENNLNFQYENGLTIKDDIEDEIESARIREEDDGIDIERIWPKTNPGDLNVKPGAIFRKLSKSKNPEDTPKVLPLFKWAFFGISIA